MISIENEPGIIRAIEDNLFSFFPLFRHLPGAETVLGSDLMWNLTDIPFALFNSVVGARIEAGKAEAVIRSVVERARGRNAPLLWWTGPATRPADLGRSLEAHGFVHEADAPGMAVDLGSVQGVISEPSDFEIQEVRDGSALGLWCRTAALAFEMPDFVREAWLAWFNAIGVQGQGPLFHFLGVWKGEPVAASSVFLDGRSAGLYNIAVLPQARGKGIGAAMTLAPLLKARTRGYGVGILHSTEMGVPLYEKLGFREFCKIGHYIKE